MKIIVLIVCLVVIHYVIIRLGNHQSSMFDLIKFVKIKIYDASRNNSSNLNDSKLIGGLSASGFDHESCLSRSQVALYQNPSPKRPSEYLISKVREYEDLHKKCGPYTEAYNQTIQVLTSKNVSSPTECSYVVWLPEAGLGNRIVSIASTFLYALLTHKVLLVRFHLDMSELFCEPFPNTTWLLPIDFPLNDKFNRSSPNTFGNMFTNKMVDTSNMSTTSFMYIYLATGLSFHDFFFYCEDYHPFFQRIPWLILKSDEYFVPSLFLISSFQDELDKMFPDKELVFHHLGRYLFNPSNKAWGLITRFYNSYLAKADEQVGLQIRVSEHMRTSLSNLMDQILACTNNKTLFPKIDMQNLNPIPSPSKNPKTKAILVTSLYLDFYENLTHQFLTFPTETGDVVSVFQPSHEERQLFGNSMHNVKAFVDMYLLSLSNVLVTTDGSTFGYVAQSLGGLRPWVIHFPEPWRTQRGCHRATSMEPCLHISPNYDCKKRAKVDMGNVVPYVRHCSGVYNWLQLTNNYSNTD